MQIELIADGLGRLSLPEVLDVVVEAGPTCVEVATGNWYYVTLGLGHPQGEAFWADFVYQLRAAGYDGVLSIEHEDTLVSAREGVARAAALLSRVAPVEAPDWAPAAV